MDTLIERSKTGGASADVDPAEEMNTVLIAVSTVPAQQICLRSGLIHTKTQIPCLIFLCHLLPFPCNIILLPHFFVPV
jgi:hypothetical protein